MPETTSWKRPVTFSVAVTAAAFAVLVAGAVHVLPFLCDDALVSLRYADRLLHGQGLTWTDGERVEGYSNLLWVLACALLGRCGLSLIDAARALGFLGMGAALAALTWTSRTARWRDGAPAIVGVSSLALAAPLQVWTVGGLEQPFVAALLAWGLVLALPLLDGDGASAGNARGLRAGAPAGLCFGLLAVTRPDGALFGVLVGLVLLVSARSRRGDLRPALAILGCTFGLVAAQLLFRLGYYGELLPNTSYVKLGSSARRLREGTLYVGLGLASCAGLVVLALAGLLVDLAQPARRARGLLLALPGGAWLVYLAVIGGDIFPGRRHLVPVVVILALLARDFAAWWSARRRPLRSAGLAASVLALAVFAVAQQRDPETERARNEVWEWDCQLTASMLGAAFSRQQPLVAVDPAGCFPFFSRLPSLDMLGLNDAFIARHPPPDRGSEPLGHELGDGPYVLSRRPDLTLFCGSRGNRHGCHASGVWLDASDEFHRLYRPVLFEERHPYVYGSWMYVRTDGRVGIQADGGEGGADRWTIPGFFLAERGDAVAIRDDQGELATESAPNTPGRFRDLVIGPGSFTVEVRASGPLAELVITGPAGEPIATLAGGHGAFVVPPTLSAISLVVTPRERSTLLYEVVVQRRAPP